MCKIEISQENLVFWFEAQAVGVRFEYVEGPPSDMRVNYDKVKTFPAHPPELTVETLKEMLAQDIASHWNELVELTKQSEIIDGVRSALEALQETVDRIPIDKIDFNLLKGQYHTLCSKMALLTDLNGENKGIEDAQCNL